MAITQVREVARADMNDEYGVTCWQGDEQVDLSPEEARAYAEEILRAAAQAEAVAVEDAAPAPQPVGSFVQTLTGEAVL